MQLEIKNHDGGFIIFDKDSPFTHQSYTQRYRKEFDQIIKRVNAFEEWISVVEKLPEIGEYVLIYNTEGGTFTGRLMANGWVACFADKGEYPMGELTAIFWRRLPEEPNKLPF